MPDQSDPSPASQPISAPVLTPQAPPTEHAPPQEPSAPPRETPQDPDPMLDVHPPHHAVTTWRDFFIHIATICVGLLIAIGLEQSVEGHPHLSHLDSLHGRRGRLHPPRKP